MATKNLIKEMNWILEDSYREAKINTEVRSTAEEVLKKFFSKKSPGRPKHVSHQFLKQ